MLLKAALPGELGKPRPVVVIQASETDVFDSLVVCPLTSNVATHGPLRVRIDPSAENGLRYPSLVMVEKVGAISRSRFREEIGVAEPDVLNSVNERLALLLGLAS